MSIVGFNLELNYSLQSEFQPSNRRAEKNGVGTAKKADEKVESVARHQNARLPHPAEALTAANRCYGRPSAPIVSESESFAGLSEPWCRDPEPGKVVLELIS